MSSGTFRQGGRAVRRTLVGARSVDDVGHWRAECPSCTRRRCACIRSRDAVAGRTRVGEIRSRLYSAARTRWRRWFDTGRARDAANSVHRKWSSSVRDCNRQGLYQAHMGNPQLPTPRYRVVESADRAHLNEVADELRLPLIVKPPNEGSTIGISRVRGYSGMAEAFQLARKYDDVVLAEEFIDGQELTCAILGDGGPGRGVAAGGNPRA